MLLDRAHEMPPKRIAPLIAEEVARVGGRNVSILLQDYGELKQQRGGRTSDDATPFLIEWRGGPADHLALLE